MDPRASSETSLEYDMHKVSKQQGPFSQSRLDFTKVESYLASIRAAGLEPTLEDIEKLRPAKHSRPDTEKYIEEYHTLLDTLCRAFSKDQLRRFTQLYKLDSKWTRAKRRKLEYAESIIEEQWGWPSLREMEKRRIDKTEIVSKTFLLTPGELFLILGKDGADLFQLSMQYNVHISLTSNPLSLLVEGLRGALNQLTEQINSLKEDVKHEIFELPTGRSIPQDLVQRISRLAGAYVENHDNQGKIRILAKNSSAMRSAERLAIRASLERGVDTHVSVLCYEASDVKRGSPIPSDTLRHYAAYPLLTPNPYPWTMTSGTAFRIRRVADWLDANSYEDISKTGGLANGKGRFMDLTENQVDLCRAIENIQTGTIGGSRLITASFGHLLLSFNETSQKTALLPPLKGYMPLARTLKWLRTARPQMTFVTSFPSAHLVPLGKRQVVNRLVYKALQTISHGHSVPADSLPLQVIRFETELPMDVVHNDRPLTPGITSFDVCDPSPSQCRIGEEIVLNLMVPDRPMDLQFSVFDYNQAPERQPSELRTYMMELHKSILASSHARPYPPPVLDFEGNKYYLHDNWTLQKSIDSVMTSTLPGRNYVSQQPTQVICEKASDLEGGQQLEMCQVTLDPSSDANWQQFLSACDQLSIAPTAQDGEEVEYLE